MAEMNLKCKVGADEQKRETSPSLIDSRTFQGSKSTSEVLT